MKNLRASPKGACLQAIMMPRLVDFIQVPEGHCWIVGDNLPASRDSRQFGPLPLALVQGKVVAKILPWKERAWVANGLQAVE